MIDLGFGVATSVTIRLPCPPPKPVITIPTCILVFNVDKKRPVPPPLLCVDAVVELLSTTAITFTKSLYSPLRYDPTTGTPPEEAPVANL